MRLRDKIKSYSFWVSLASAIILILKILGTRFGFSIDESMISDLFTALCSILVLLGIIVVPNTPQASTQKQNSKEQIKINQAKTNESNVEIFNSVDDSVLEKNSDDLNSNINTNSQNENSLCYHETNDEIDNKENINNLSQNNLNIQIDSTFIGSENLSTNQTIPSYTSQTCSIQEPSQDVFIKEQEMQENEVICNSNLKSILEEEKKKFAGNLDLYIFELQEEIRKTREGM